MTNTANPDSATHDLAVLPADIEAMSFEAALAELEGIVRQLEDGRGKLDEAISAYERGALLRRHCERKLGEANARIERITQRADGSLTATPVEIG
jgi:exodeoxyribonuclease VII small subunit